MIQVRNLIISGKGEQTLPQSYDHHWICDFAFRIDIAQYVDEMNISQQGANHLVHELFHTITVFERKSGLWELQL
jgi:hypothetical protein